MELSISLNTFRYPLVKHFSTFNSRLMTHQNELIALKTILDTALLPITKFISYVRHTIGAASRSIGNLKLSILCPLSFSRCTLVYFSASIGCKKISRKQPLKPTSSASWNTHWLLSQGNLR